MKKPVSAIAVMFVLSFSAFAQTADISLRLDERFFEALLEAVFKNSSPPEFPLSLNDRTEPAADSLVSSFFGPSSGACSETLKLQREIDGAPRSSNPGGPINRRIIIVVLNKQAEAALRGGNKKLEVSSETGVDAGEIRAGLGAEPAIRLPGRPKE